MIDLHSHILPGIDDGANDISISLAMARIAVADGTTHIACTPHFQPGIYENTVKDVSAEISVLKAALHENGICLQLIAGGDIHIAPNLPQKLASGELPMLADTRYFLFEPTHHVLPPGIVKLCRNIMAQGFSPILTHPERLAWIENHYGTIRELDELGLVIQLTAGSITGRFGKRARYWSERMLDEGRVDIIASDAHNIQSRPPGLSRARDAIARRLGEEVADKMVRGNPARILDSRPVFDKPRRKSIENEQKWRSVLSKIGFG